MARKRFCLEVDEAEPVRVVRTVLPADDGGDYAESRGCRVGIGDQVHRGLLVPSPAGEICSLPVQVDDDDR